ncbi:hypothetical protein E2C04_13065 [Nocardioides daphniae]|uniref:AMP-dependent synthetase/ligase domain-containing protein n=1 Tax=Nocardioides daphniae TaxID=402297 RepID=A0A4P7UCJ0_9ACTN|nr:hypothetical protein E2C04_13065 [Nocardioides daphniae]
MDALLCGRALRLGQHDDAVAVLDAGGTQLTHAELADLVARRAASWGPARRLVLIEGGNRLDALVAHLAAVEHGHVSLLVPPRDPAAARHPLATAYDVDIECSEAGDVVHRDTSTHDLHPDLAMLSSTSGSTGSPKLVRLSATNLTANAESIADYLGLGDGDRALTSLPLHYCYGLSVVHSHLLAGGALVLTEASVVDEEFWAVARRHRATSFAGVPHTFRPAFHCWVSTRAAPRPCARSPRLAGGWRPSGSSSGPSAGSDRAGTWSSCTARPRPPRGWPGCRRSSRPRTRRRSVSPCPEDTCAWSRSRRATTRRSASSSTPAPT